MSLPSAAPADMTVDERLNAFLQYRSLLLSIAYRMLGTFADAEDMLQETFLRWQQSSDVNVLSPKAFLVTVITRLCINHLQSARVQREQYVGEWLPEPMVTLPGNDPSALPQVDESLSLAFLMLLERLTPMERAVFLLREVFDYDYSEVARIVGQNEANCRQIFRRSRLHIKEMRPRFDASLELKEKLLREFLEATSRGDMAGLLQIFSQDITVHTDGGGKASALQNPVFGCKNSARVLISGNRKFRPQNSIIQFVQVNGQPGLASYLDGRVETIITVDVVNSQIRNVYILRNPDKLQNTPSLPS
ncbi:MAG TPA: RNA polymerase sigma-70 factor [Verrucomicrobiae bacterium]|nr:RNA polymerase sigma-70 factor [Verrucomicrobiae bacterium]